ALSFLGFANYVDTLNDREFWQATQWTLIYTAITLPVQLVLGLLVALCLDKVVHCRNVMISVILLPFIVTPVVGTMFFALLFKDPWGFYTQMLNAVGIHIDWYASVWGSRALLMIFRVWMATPFVILILFAGLQSMNREPLESSLIDGANAWQRILYVVIPALRPLMLFVAMVIVMDNYREFDSVFVMTQGGPFGATETLMFYNYKVSFAQQALGRGSAVSVLTVVGVMVLLLPFLYLTYREQTAQK
ncbi:sugar ABC transporter permease, partial [Paraburkholderia sp.]|uniref:carbohydrate ABC transporter permease n=1 Tax=Paraburkholderia sp. TaxID=1926495 RepID=UPI002D3AA42D